MVVFRRGQIQRIGWVIKTLETQVGQFLLGCKCPARRGIFVQEPTLLGVLPTAFFLQHVLQLILSLLPTNNTIRESRLPQVRENNLKPTCEKERINKNICNC